MADNTLAIRFSEEKYSTRSEVAEALGTNLIEPIWNTIILYRKQYRKQLSLFDITKVPFTIAYMPGMLKKVEEIEEKISEYIVTFGGLQEGSVAKFTIYREMTFAELRYIARLNKINVNDVALNNIIDYKNTEPLYEPLFRYFQGLTHLEKNPHEKFNEDTIRKYYSILSGDEVEESFYRKNEINAFSQRLLIDREYAGAPTQEIPNLMNKLLNYVNTSNDSFVIKVAVVSYMINYIKPFEKANREMAAILCKLIISLNEVESAACYIPLESVAADEKGVFANIAREIQRSRDLTYMVTRLVDYFKVALETVQDRIVQVNIADVQKSYLLGESKEEFKEEFGFEPSKEMVDVVGEIKEEVKPVEAPHYEKPAKPVQPVQPSQPVVRMAKVNDEDELSDKQLRRMAQNLLEEDPLLKKGQAHFYVRHCTKGKYYTIQQYKKCEGCVYETARTSMDTLAKLGYYRREQVKNKFVYTPIDKE